MGHEICEEIASIAASIGGSESGPPPALSWNLLWPACFQNHVRVCKTSSTKNSSSDWSWRGERVGLEIRHESLGVAPRLPIFSP